MDDPNPESSDIAYLGRLNFDRNRKLILIAGVHAIGSVGAAAYLQANITSLYDKVASENFSMVVSSRHDGAEIVESGAACPPERH